MENRTMFDDSKPVRTRRISDDVTSLDSWSDLNEKESRNSRHDGHESLAKPTELLLSPYRLSEMEYPPEPRLVKVKLQKSDCSHSGHSSRHNRFFQVSQPSGSRVSALQEKQKKPTQRNRHSSIDDIDEENSDVNFETSNAFHSLDSSRQCDCTDCLETPSFEKSLHRTSKPAYIKQHKHPLLLRKRHKDPSLNSNDPNDLEQSEKVKNKIMSVWNNVRYGKPIFYSLVS